MKFKNRILGAVLALTSLVLTCSPPDLPGAAVKSGYVSQGATASTNQSQVVFPADPTKTIRLLSVSAVGIASGDLLTLMTCLTNYTTVTVSNAVSATNIAIGSTLNFASNDVVVIQDANDIVWQGVVWGTNGGTNLIFTNMITAGFATNSAVYRMSDLSYQTVISNSYVRLSSECLLGAPRRRPVLVKAAGTAGDLINWATVHYDDN